MAGPFDLTSGNTAWDQGIGTLSSALFPDPSKIAAGYYYGSEARKAQLEANKAISQQNAANWIVQKGFGQNPTAPTFGQVGNAVPGAAPVMLPTVPQPPPPMPSQGQINAAAGNLSSAVVPYTVGTPQPGSSPAPGAAAPADPVTTTSNGQAPSNQPGAGPIHPASTVQAPPGTGVVHSPPAGPNGSPADPTPAAQLYNQYVIMGEAAGRDAASSQALGNSFLGSAFAQGQLSEPTYRALLASGGITTPYTTAQTEAGALEREKLSQAGQTQRTGMVVQGENYRAGLPLQTYTTPGGDTFQAPLSQMQGTTQIMSPEEVKRRNEGVTVLGPDNQPIPMSRGRAETLGSTIYEPTTANTQQQQRGAYGAYVERDNPLAEHYTTAEDAAAKGWVPKPTNPQEVAAMLDNAILQTTDPTKKQALIDMRNTIGAPPKTPDTKEDYGRRFIQENEVAKAFPPPA